MPDIAVHGPFSLAAAKEFWVGFTPAALPDAAADGPLRLAFPVEDDWRPAGVAVTEHPGGVRIETYGPGAGDAAVAQAARSLFLDVDGSGLAAVGERDPVVAGLLRRWPGLRPVCFASPYEAAVWAILSQRVRMTQAAAVKARIVARHGAVVQVDGQEVRAFPPPQELVAAAVAEGVQDVKVERLREVADAALDGVLDAAELRALPVEEALARLRTVPGVGPFSAELILVRGAGHPDVFPSAERRLHAEMCHAYGLSDPTSAELAAVAEEWRPYRSWIALLMRVDRERRTGGTGRHR
ncbi:DNA-3-methyladenine glycosylase family protein [Pseudonocardia sp. CA-107938]|uniref:DNA-3-methyladenine glycosylase family protein n=1 Tax=Pseudonocardia sp. CA-107938 TaxID=3240021 RepID=UPI003D90197D